MNNNETTELFKKRWEKYRKMGAYKYALFLASMYAATVLFVSVFWDYSQSELENPEILSFITKDVWIKTGTFFAVGLAFGFYHFKKSEKKYHDGIK